MSNSSIRLKGKNNLLEIEKGCRIAQSRVYISGENNKIIMKKGSVLEECLVWINGSNNTIFFGEDVGMVRSEFGVEHDSGSIVLEGKIFVGGYMKLGTKKNNSELCKFYTAEGRKILIKKGTVVSDGVVMRTSDSHPIYDENKKRINEARDITVGERVWLCSGASLLKGAGIGNNSILGYKAVLTKDYSDKENVILAGFPAKITRENTDWKLHWDS